MCVFFCFEKKTPLEWRISDWSSDVALPISLAYLPEACGGSGGKPCSVRSARVSRGQRRLRSSRTKIFNRPMPPQSNSIMSPFWTLLSPRWLVRIASRSEERRGGKECDSRCRFWWAPVHEKKKKKQT